MLHRLDVVSGCSPRCPSCTACSDSPWQASLEQVTAVADAETLLLGGGDATTWRHLAEFLALNQDRPVPQAVLVEAPARALTTAMLRSLVRRGVTGVLVQIEGAGAVMLKTAQLGDGERVVAEAEALGLQAHIRLCIRPITLTLLSGVAGRLSPRPTWVELIAADWGQPPAGYQPAAVERLLSLGQVAVFSGHRQTGYGYLPPCTMPTFWKRRPAAWQSAAWQLNPDQPDQANAVLPACATCDLRMVCRWNDLPLLSERARAAARPVVGGHLPWLQARKTEIAVPAFIVKQRPPAEIACVSPWTTMEITDPVGDVRQCCSTWTVRHCGNVHGTTLGALWNGEGYQTARRIMSGADLAPLCQPLCSRLHDRKFSESKLQIQPGSERFVKNQLLMAEDIAQRREVVRSRPIRMTMAASTFCNYNCIMCDNGRTPRRDLADHVWEELPEFMPTLRSLTLLGGEPLAIQNTMRFLRDFDSDRWPDAVIDLVTNGSLLTEKVLDRLGKCSFGDLTVSLNAGTAEVYEQVQRGLSLATVLENIDALVRYRDRRPRYFGITLSFVVQPANAHTLIPFGELASQRNLRVRLIALSGENAPELDFYRDQDVVASVVAHIDAFIAYCKKIRPEWLPEAWAARTAVLSEAAARRHDPAPAAGGSILGQELEPR